MRLSWLVEFLNAKEPFKRCKKCFSIVVILVDPFGFDYLENCKSNAASLIALICFCVLAALIIPETQRKNASGLLAVK